MGAHDKEGLRQFQCVGQLQESSQCRSSDLVMQAVLWPSARRSLQLTDWHKWEAMRQMRWLGKQEESRQIPPHCLLFICRTKNAPFSPVSEFKARSTWTKKKYQGFKVLLSFWPLGARKRSYIRTRHSLWTSTCVLLINNYHTLYIKNN